MAAASGPVNTPPKGATTPCGMRIIVQALDCAPTLRDDVPDEAIWAAMTGDGDGETITRMLPSSWAMKFTYGSLTATITDTALADVVAAGHRATRPSCTDANGLCNQPNCILTKLVAAEAML